LRLVDGGVRSVDPDFIEVQLAQDWLLYGGSVWVVVFAGFGAIYPNFFRIATAFVGQAELDLVGSLKAGMVA